MQVKDLMTPHVECLAPETTIRQAAERMKDLDVGVFPICENDRLIGMVTDRDLALRGLGAGKDPAATTAREVMTEGVVTCFEDQTEREAGELMEKNRVRRLVVLSRDKRMTGIVSLGDLATQSRDADLAGRTLEGVSSG